MGDETKRNMTIVKSEVANTLTSAASNHIIATATDVYDKDLELYQSEINQLINNMSADNVTSIAAEDIDPKLAKVEFNEAEKTITVTDKDGHSYTFKINHYGTGWGDDYDDSYCEDGMLPNFDDFQLKMDHLIDVDGDHTVSGAIMKLKDKIKPVEVGYGLEVQTETGIIDAEVEYTEGGDDAARRILGGGWRMPTAKEWMEVLNYCDFNVEAVKATIPGVEVTSKTNGNSIFLPYRGYVTGSPDNPTQGTSRAAYWGNDIETGAIHGQGIGNAHNIDIQTTIPPYLGDSPHWIGLPIRPVSMSEGVDLGLPSGIRFAESNLTATGLAEHDYDYGDYFAWAEITPKETYTLDNCKYGFPSTKYTVSTLTSLDEDVNKYITRHGDELQTKIVPGEHQQVLTSIVDENGNRTMEWREVPDPAKAEYEADKILYGGPITLTNLLAIANPQVGEFYQVYSTQDGDVFSGDFDYDGNHLNEGTFLKWNGERWVFDEKHEQKQFLSSYLYNRSYSIYPFGDRNGADNGKWALIWQWTTSNIDKTGVSFVNKVMCADNQMGYSMKFTVDSRSTKDTDMPYSFVDVEYLVPNLTGTKPQNYFGEDPFDLRTFIRVTAIDNVYRVYARVWYDMNGMSGVDVLFPGYSVNLDGFATPVPLNKREDLMEWDQHIGNEITRINYNREVPTKTVKFKVPEESFIGEGYTVTNRGTIEHGPSKDQNGNTVWQTATKVDIQLDPAYDKYIVFTDNSVLYKSITAIGSDKGRTFRNGAKLILMADSISAWDHTYHGISVWEDTNCDNSEFTIDKFGYTSAYTSTLLWQYTMREEFVWWNGRWWGTQYTPVFTTSTIGTGTYSKLPPTAAAVYNELNGIKNTYVSNTTRDSDLTSLWGGINSKVTSVKIGESGTAITPTDGVITLPPYPTEVSGMITAIGVNSYVDGDGHAIIAEPDENGKATLNVMARDGSNTTTGAFKALADKCSSLGDTALGSTYVFPVRSSSDTGSWKLATISNLNTYNDGRYAAKSHNQASSTINALTGYSKGTSATALSTTDTLNSALSKLENQIDAKANASDVPSIDGLVKVDGSNATETTLVALLNKNNTSTTNPAGRVMIVMNSSKTTAYRMNTEEIIKSLPLGSTYAKATSSSAIASTDTVISALGKLEKALDDKGAGSGTVTQVKIGTTAYDPTDGVISLPAYPTVSYPVTSVAGKTGDVTLAKADVGLGNVGNFKAVSTVASQGLTDTEKSNARANIGAGTSSLTLGTSSTTAAAGNHTHTATLVADSGTPSVTLAHNTTYKLTAGGSSVIFKTPADNNTINTTGAAASTGTKLFLVGSSKQDTYNQTNTNVNCYIGTDNCLYSGGNKVLTSHQSLTSYLKVDGSNGTSAGVSALLNKLTEGSSDPQDADYYIAQYSGGGTTTTTYHRRPVSKLWNYIKSKADSVYAAAGHTHSNYLTGITKAMVTTALGYTPPTSDTNTTYTFASGSTSGAFSVTPSGGSAQSVVVKNVVTTDTAQTISGVKTFTTLDVHNSGIRVGTSTTGATIGYSSDLGGVAIVFA